MHLKSKDVSSNAETINLEIVGNIKKLQGLMADLKNLVNEEGGVGAKVRDIKRNIQATKQNFNSANATAEDAHKVYENIKADFESTKTQDDYKEGLQFLDEVNGLRETQNKAFSLQQNVQKLIDDVANYKKEWDDLNKQHEEVKGTWNIYTSLVESIKQYINHMIRKS